MSHAWVALLRAINVTGHNKIKMADLRELATELGWSQVQTYIQSGNLIFQTRGAAPSLARRLEAALRDEFGFEVPVVVRSRSEWSNLLAANPFSAATRSAPQHVMLALADGPPKADAVERLAQKCVGQERVAISGEALWIHYAQGSGKSKLTTAVLDKAVGKPVTTRNWRTLLAIDALLASPAPPTLTR